MAKLNFPHHYSSLQSHDPSEIILKCWFCAQESLLSINVDKSCAPLYFCGNRKIDQKENDRIHFRILLHYQKTTRTNYTTLIALTRNQLLNVC